MVEGITDEELALLVEGGWFDDYTGTPGWGRTVKDEDGKEMWQSVLPSPSRPGWWAGGEELVDSLDEALSWCDDRAAGYKILPAEGTATKQEERFAAFLEQEG